MAQLGRFEMTVEDLNGNAVSGASVQICPQGATVSVVNSATSYTTYDAGGLVSGETVQVNAASGTTRAITALTATNVTVGAPGFVGAVQYDRIVQVTTLPTLYREATGTVTIANPLTSDSNGYVSAFIPVGKYDVILSGGGLTTRLIQDVEVTAGETFRSTIFDSGTAVGFIFDTLRSITTAGSKLISVRTGASEKFYIDRLGGFTAAQASTITAGGLTITTGGLTVSAGTTAVQALTSVGITNTGAISSTTDVTMRRPIAHNGTLLAATDWALSIGWGANADAVVTCPVAGGTARDTGGQIRIAAGTGAYLANPTATLTFKDGAYPNAYAVVTGRHDIGSTSPNQYTIPFLVSAASTTNVVFKFVGTPAGGEAYGLQWLLVGI